MMSSRPPDHLKEVAAELAALIFSKSRQTQRMAELLQQLNYAPSQPETAADHATVETGDHIGIWRHRWENGNTFYERDPEKLADWNLWANTDRIHPKGDKRRVLLFGESAARGYYYDPYYTVAMEMDAVLNASDRMSSSEVIDLARTAISMDGLLNLMKEAVPLQPDAVVVFAGNNWLPSLIKTITREDYDRIYEWIKEDKIEEVIPFLRQHLSKQVVSFLEEVKRIFVDRNIPVIFIIPGYNIKDWKSIGVEQIPTRLPGERTSEWLAARDRVHSAFIDGRDEIAGEGAAEMIRLDPTNPLGYEWLAEFHNRQHRRADAVNCLELAHDTGLFNRSRTTTPKCYSIIAETIASHAPGYGITTVNLRGIFRELVNEIPGRNFFMDYCHLNIEGIRIAVSHAIRTLLEVLTGQQWSPERILGSGLPLPPKVEATAHFCAVTHHVHFGQTGDMLDFHCRRAAALSEDIRKVMLFYTDFSSRKAPSTFCPSLRNCFFLIDQAQLVRSAFLLRLRNGKMMDIELNEAIIRALQVTGMDIRDQVSGLRVQEHGVGPGKTDLLQSFYCYTSVEEMEFVTKRCFLQVREPVRAFYFVVDGAPGPLSFDLVYRTPTLQYGQGTIKICIDREDHVVSECPSDAQFRRHSFEADVPLKKGVHRLLIKWPTVAAPFVPERAPTYPGFLETMFLVTGDIQELSVYSGSPIARTPINLSSFTYNQ